LTRNRLRADAMFLQAAAADDVHERLIAVNRTFMAPVVVTGFLMRGLNGCPARPSFKTMKRWI
jgi:hypothetical protein